ncbi:hypothetical protein AVEN_45578-1 [Araneus ventricosus]|uniref:Uncharacterized protein n=1 Tax=Araneus ventricosus TaxID=182803 RepID=A0A4Y2VE81_ARAVE|nr:hypothetical protein AVEN_45578-1 [Araneus ventricosus]
MDISGQTFPHHLERVSPDSFIFSPSHLGGSSIEAPYKRHSQPLQSLKATLFLERATLPLRHFVVFAFGREARCSLPTIVFQFYGLECRMGNGTG